MRLRRIDHLHALRKAGGEILQEFAGNKIARRAHFKDLMRIKERKNPDPYMNPTVRIRNVQRVLKFCPPPPPERRPRRW